METILKLITSPFAGITTFGILSIIIWILIWRLSDKNKTIREIKAEKDELIMELFSFDPFKGDSYEIFQLSESLKGIIGIKENKFLISNLFFNATQVFCKKFDNAKKFSEINLFLIDIYRYPHLYEGLISEKFFEKTHKKVRELTEQYFEELKLKKDRKALQDLLETLKIVFGNYEDLHASFYGRINEQLSLLT